MQNNIIDFANDYGDVISTCCNWRCVLASTLCGIFGTLIFCMPFVTDIASSALMMACIIFGPILSIAGLCMAVFHKPELRYLSTDSPVKIHSSYISPTRLDAVERQLRNANIALGPNVTLEGAGQLRIDTLTSDDGKFCLCMIFQYVPYFYKPIYGPYVITADLARRFKECKI